MKIYRAKLSDTSVIAEVINDGARAYLGHVPDVCLDDPYMSLGALEAEIEDGVEFCLLERGANIAAVMGIQDKRDVTLIRHAYVRKTYQGNGCGTKLLDHLRGLSDRPFLIGTWRAAFWAIDFYSKHGFRQLTDLQTALALAKYWQVPKLQAQHSVVLASADWAQ